MQSSRTSCIGILTSGGDCPGLNAAIRGVAKAAIGEYGIRVIGFHDGFRGLVENRFTVLENLDVSGILTQGGTILGTARDRPDQMFFDGEERDTTSTAARNLRAIGAECLVCLGGGGTQRNANHLRVAGGVDVLTLPKTIDNDVVETDVAFGFDSAMSIASEAIDRLHTTATSHHRIIVCEVMGHDSGWLALGAGLAGGADVVLIPEIPYDLEAVAAHLQKRRESGKRFSIVAVAEGALSKVEAANGWREREERRVVIEHDETGRPYHLVQEPKASRIARELQRLTGTEARVTSLGHVQRGGSPSARDRLLSTLLGTKAAELLAEGTYNVMVAVRGESCEAVPLERVAGRKRVVPRDHSWVRSAQLVGTCLGE